MQLTYDIKEIENWSKIDILESLLSFKIAGKYEYDSLTLNRE